MLNLRDALAAVRADGRHQQIRCPAHDDGRASLAIDPGDEPGKVLIHCHAGCAPKAVVDAAGLTLADLAPPARQDGPGTRQVVATYDYHGRDGERLYSVLRYQPKGFSQRAANGTPSLKGIPRVLYRLPLIMGKPQVWVVEGEKDADRLAGLGFDVTTWAGGAAGFRWHLFDGVDVAEVILLPDNDEAGLQAMENVRRSAESHGIRVRVLTLPGLPPKGDVSDWLDAGHTADELRALVATPTAPAVSATGYDLDRNSRGEPYSNVANTVAVLQKDPLWSADRVWYDGFLDRVLFANSPVREWTDADDTALAVYLQQSVGMRNAAINHAAAAVALVARQRERHCIREYLEALEDDGESRIETALTTYFGAEPGDDQPGEYLAAVSKNLFLSMVARVMRPGCQVDTMTILEGAQGIGKSRGLRVLGGAWYRCGTESMVGKDFLQALPGAWLVEVAELSAATRADVERLKVIISTPADSYRPSYGRHTKTVPRQSVMVGTTNRDDYGVDDTGLRRFLPVRCARVDVAGLERDRDRLFAEALTRYRDGESWWELPGAVAADIQASRRESDDWTEPIAEYCRVRDEVTTLEVLTEALKFKPSEIGRRETVRVASVLRLAGWKKQTFRRDGRGVKGFTRYDT